MGVAAKHAALHAQTRGCGAHQGRQRIQGERIRWIALAANEMADVLLHSDPEDVDARIQAVTRKYVQALGVGSKDIQSATVTARQKLIELAVAMEIRVAPGSAAAKLLKVPDTTARQKRPRCQSRGDRSRFERL